MTESEARVSGDLARLIANQGDPRKLRREHTPDRKGRCPTCKSIGCSLYPAALAALKILAERKQLGGSKRDG